MAWIGETSGDGSNGGEESKRRKIEKLESEKRYLIPRSCSRKNTEEGGRKIEESLSSRIKNTEIEESSTSEDDDDDGIERNLGPKVGETIDNLLDMLFTDSSDFLVKFNGQKVKFDDLNGKTIVLFMLSLVGKCCHAVGNGKGKGMMDLVDSYNELRPHDGVEFVFVPRFKRQTESTIGKCSLCSEEECFNNLFSKMPWPSVPFSDKQKCHRIETMLWPSFPSYSHSPYYIIFDPKGKVLLTNAYCFKPAPSIFHLYGGADLFSLADLSLQNLKEKDRETIKKLDLDQLLKSPYRDFLLARDGTKVPVSSLRDKVVGLYFCDNVPTPPRMEALKKVYQEAMDMGRDFEIVQINFHFRNNYEDFPHNEEMPLQVWSEDIPWLTLPYKDMCCRRLRRLFRWHRFYWYTCHWKGDSLVIVDPHNFNIDGTRYERNSIHIVEHLGIEAYPFTRKRAVELEYAKLRQVKLHTIFPPGGPPLVRPSTSRGCDQVPRSELYGKPVLVLFSLHSRHGEFNSKLESKYNSQSRKFEVVYVSHDHDESTFGEFIKEMPWLVHPYSLELGLRWKRQFALYFNIPDTLYFRADGELVMSLGSILKYLSRFYCILDWDFTSY